MSAGRDINSSEWGIALVMDVSSLTAPKRYKEHPKHKLVSAFCRKVTTDRCAVDFES